MYNFIAIFNKSCKQAIMKKFFKYVFRVYVDTFKHVPPGAVL